MLDMEARGYIFNIQSYSVHDGPGIRVVCFLKGCPLRCAWCSNPESQTTGPQPAYDQRKCLLCQKCVAACPAAALRRAGDTILRHPKLCKNGNCAVEDSFPCVNACASKAMFSYGRHARVRDIIAEIEADSLFFGRSGGGLTLSGGEALMQPEFACALLDAARLRGIETALETSAYAPEKTMLEVCSRLDCLIVDIKHIDEQKHKYWTGVPNHLILRNIKAARAAFPDLPVLARTPLIPGVNDSEQDIKNIVEFVKKINGATYEILPYHALGAQKYVYLDRQYKLEHSVTDQGKTVALQQYAATLMGN